jgi:hypothetical protein
VKPTPLSQILRSIRLLSREHKIYFLRGLIALEKKRSFRREELEATLKLIVNAQLKSENRLDRKKAA